jgi:uncharacterized protein YqeY
MSKIKERLKIDLKDAMKAKEVFKRDTIRFLMSALKQVEVDERRELSDDDIYKIIQKSIKQREDAAQQYKDADRDDLYQKEINEALLLKEYMPKQLSSDELSKIVKELIQENDASGMKDMGKIMKLTTQSVGNSADGKSISEIVKSLLNDN